MSGFEYRGTIDGTVNTPAVDMEFDPAYFAVAKSNEPVTINASGKVIAALPAAVRLYGVSAGREFITRDATVKVGKVRTSLIALYEAQVTGGTPAVSQTYGITADYKVDASATASPGLVRVRKVLPNGNVLITLV